MKLLKMKLLKIKLLKMKLLKMKLLESADFLEIWKMCDCLNF